MGLLKLLARLALSDERFLALPKKSVNLKIRLIPFLSRGPGTLVLLMGGVPKKSMRSGAGYSVLGKMPRALLCSRAWFVTLLGE